MHYLTGGTDIPRIDYAPSLYFVDVFVFWCVWASSVVS